MKRNTPRARAQFPNPGQLVHHPEWTTLEERVHAPYEAVISYDDFVRRRTWMTDPTLIKWRPRVVAPVATIAPPRLRLVGKVVMPSAGAPKRLHAQFDAILAEITRRWDVPAARFYGGDPRLIARGMGWEWGVQDLKRCADDTHHRSNNQRIIIWAQANSWELRCQDRSCPQWKKAATGMQGRVLYM